MPHRSQPSPYQSWYPLLLMLVLGVGFLGGMRTARSTYDPFSVSPFSGTKDYSVDEVLRFIDDRYMDEIEVRHLAESAIQLIVDSLDAHSMYISPQALQDFNNHMSGQFVGLGIHYIRIQDTLRIVHVYDHSPAANNGLQVNDQILIVNTDTLTRHDLTHEQILEYLKGVPNEKIHLTIRRCNQLIDLSVVPDEIAIPSITHTQLVGDSTVYIAINQFNSHTSKEFLDSLERYHESGVLRHLIVDLRGNPGGYLQEAVLLLNQFFDEKGVELVYTEGNNSPKRVHKTSGRPYLQIDQLYILIDENSASASEIVAGAVQDLDRGIIVGRRSFGKGLVQEQYDLRNGGALKLTIARYHIPSGRVVQKAFTSLDDYNAEVNRRAYSGEWLNQDAMPMPDTTTFHSSHGRILYGGRGIVPDVFIPMDSFDILDSTGTWSKISETLASAWADAILCDNKEAPVNAADWIDTYLDRIGDHDRFLIEYLSPTNAESLIHLIETKVQRQTKSYQAYQRYKINHDPYIHEVIDLIDTKAGLRLLSIH